LRLRLKCGKPRTIVKRNHSVVAVQEVINGLRPEVDA